MGLGALAALDDAGKAGTDKVHIVSIDGTKGAVQAIVDGNFDAVIESNPAYGDSAQAALEAYVNGDGAPGRDHHDRQPVRLLERSAGPGLRHRLLTEGQVGGRPSPAAHLFAVRTRTPRSPEAGGDPHDHDGQESPTLAVRGLSKTFGGVRALDDVSLDLLPGSVHALVGENGAGKSTLIKVMTGVYPIDSGEVRYGGEPVASPRRAPRNRRASPRSTRKCTSHPSCPWPGTSSSAASSPSAGSLDLRRMNAEAQTALERSASPSTSGGRSASSVSASSRWSPSPAPSPPTPAS